MIFVTNLKKKRYCYSPIYLRSNQFSVYRDLLFIYLLIKYGQSRVCACPWVNIYADTPNLLTKFLRIFSHSMNYVHLRIHLCLFFDLGLIPSSAIVQPVVLKMLSASAFRSKNSPKMSHHEINSCFTLSESKRSTW